LDTGRRDLIDSFHLCRMAGRRQLAYLPAVALVSDGRG
jgi:hypothetical protein